MSDKKLTGNDIKMALDICTQGRDIKICWNCPLYDDLETSAECCERLNTNTLNYINRLEENGVIPPPVKVRDTVYYYCDEFHCVLPYFVESFHIDYLDEERDYWHWEANSHAEETDELLDEIDFDLDDIGKTVFLTKEEAEIKKLQKELEENNMSSAPWGNETERADYYQKELEIQRKICERLDTANEKLKAENVSFSKEIINTKIETYKQCIEEVREKIVNTPFDVDFTGKTNEYKEGCLNGLVAKQNNILDILDNILKETIGEK